MNCFELDLLRQELVAFKQTAHFVLKDEYEKLVD